MRTQFCYEQTPVLLTYGWTDRKNKNNISPQPEGRDIIPNKYISRVYCVHFNMLTSDTFSVYFVHPVAFTSHTGLTSFRVYCYILRVYWFIEYIKTQKILPKSMEKNPETFTVLGLLSVTINEIVTAARCTLVYGQRPLLTIFLIKNPSHNVWSTINPTCTIRKTYQKLRMIKYFNGYNKVNNPSYLTLCQDAANATRLLRHYAFTEFWSTIDSSVYHSEGVISHMLK